MPKLLVRNVPPERLEVCFHLTKTIESGFQNGSIVPSGEWTCVSNQIDSPSVLGAWAPFSSGEALRDSIALLNLPGIVDAAAGNLREKVDQFCRMLSSSPDYVEHKGKHVVVGGGFSRSTTIHPVSRQFVGLHIDSFERRRVAELRQAKNRLCVNLGPHSRWFLFSSVDTSEAAAACGLTGSEVLSTSHFREYAFGKKIPIFRLRMDPGHAYIAPTERLLHDGQAENNERNWLYTVMGHFDRTTEAQEFSVM